jgi:hypothetical protein
MKQIANLLKKVSTAQVASVLAIVFVFVFALAPVALAQFQVPSAGNTGLPNESNFTAFMMRIINIALAVAGLIAVLFLIIGGFRYITSAGNEETAEQAKKIITNAIIGIVVIILSFVIVRVITNALITNQV